MELYEIVWQEVSHIWKLYDKKFWSTRVICLMLPIINRCWIRFFRTRVLQDTRVRQILVRRPRLEPGTGNIRVNYSRTPSRLFQEYSNLIEFGNIIFLHCLCEQKRTAAVVCGQKTTAVSYLEAALGSQKLPTSAPKDERRAVTEK